MSHEIMTHNCALAVEPSTFYFGLSFHVLDFVHPLKMVGHTLMGDGSVAQHSIRALPLTYRDGMG